MMFWVDLEDLIRYFFTGVRPSGIQRLSFELSCALGEIGGDRVRFCRHATKGRGFVMLDWPDTRSRLERLMARGAMRTDARMTARPLLPDFQDPDRTASPARNLVRRLPLDLRIPLAAIYAAERRAAADLGHAVRVQAEALRGLRTFGANFWRRAASAPGLRHLAGTDGATGTVRFGPGDVLISAGATWQFPDYAARVDEVRAQGVRFAPLVCDIVPLLFPEWSVRATSEAFESWVAEVLTRADILFTISDATRRDVADYARRKNLSLPPALPLPLGASFPQQADSAAPALHPRPYVLFVSTIEPRKNHGFMLRLWRELITREPPGEVPDLVLAGRIGWLAGDIVAQAENAGWFGGRVRLIESPTDAELAILYRDCMFSIYPSFYEGWGLPVTESLWFGKPVAASSRASIPEAGGEFCVYFDPDDLNDAYGVVIGLIRNLARRAALEDAIVRRFDPPSWHDSARALLEALGAPAPAPGGVPVTAMPAAALSSPTG